MSLSPYEGFKVETDPFVIEADLEVDLDDKWTSLAQHLLNETNDKKQLHFIFKPGSLHIILILKERIDCTIQNSNRG